MKRFDAHVHIIDVQFPVIQNDGYTPPEYLIEHYLAHTTDLNITGGAIVSGSFQAFDQQYLVCALQRLGPQFCGVTQLPAHVTDDEIRRLHEAEVRAIRFNVQRGGSANITELDRLARRVYDVAGWHSELYIDAKHLPDIAGVIKTLPVVSIDHLGLSKEGLPHLLSLVEKGVYVKATGFGRVSLNVAEALKAIDAVNPRALMFGTDLPSTRAKRPFHRDDVTLIEQLFDGKDAQRIFHDNAYSLYFKK